MRVQTSKNPTCICYMPPFYVCVLDLAPHYGENRRPHAPSHQRVVSSSAICLRDLRSQKSRFCETYAGESTSRNSKRAIYAHHGEHRAMWAGVRWSRSIDDAKHGRQSPVVDIVPRTWKRSGFRRGPIKRDENFGRCMAGWSGDQLCSSM